MPRGAAITTEAVVLRRQKYADSHLIVEMLTPDHGRVSALARGARASKRRFAGALDLFIQLRVELYPGGNLWTLHAAQVIDPRLGIRQDLHRLGRATTLVECAAILTSEDAPDAEGYGCLVAALDATAHGDDPSAVEHFFGMLEAAGIAPDFSACGRCGVGVALEICDGGVLCRRCSAGRGRIIPDGLRQREFQGDVDDAAQVLINLVEHHAGRRLKTTPFG